MRPRCIVGATCAALLLGACASVPPEEDPVQIRLADLDARLARIERVVTNQSLVDLAQRLDSLQGDVRTLRGELDELQNGGHNVLRQQRDLYGDLDKRVAALENGVRGGPPTGTGPTVATAGPAASGEQAVYNQAFEALKISNYPAAIAGFKSFLAAYPTSDLASNAQYWLGEAYYVTRDFPNAAAAFERVEQNWPRSRKAADAMVKLGFTQAELKRFAAARVTLTQVVAQYPGTEAAKLADDRLRKLPPP
jgi:tol-pal system protein YbgF